MASRTDFIGQKLGSYAMWFVPHRYHHRWLAEGNAILRSARPSDGTSDRIVPMSRVKAYEARDEHQEAVEIEPAKRLIKTRRPRKIEAVV